MKRDAIRSDTQPQRGYADLQQHLDTSRKEGLLLTIDRPVDKDSERHPLVRWQYVGGIEEHERKAFLLDATMKEVLPPLALPKREYMDRAKTLWEALGLPKLRPQSPWFGAATGDWLPHWDDAAKRTAEGDYLENGRVSERRQREGLKPETRFRPDEKS